MSSKQDQAEASVAPAAEKSADSRPSLLGLPPNVVRLGLVSFFADISTEMLYPLLPIFLRVVLQAPVVALGIIEGAAEATASLLRTVSGRLSDLSGRRRPYLLAGYSISALAKPLIAAGTLLGWPVVLLARVSDRFGKGLRSSARDALLADSTPLEIRGRAFGWHRAMDTAGAVLGPLLTVGLLYLLLVRIGHSLRFTLQLAFVLAVIPGLLGALLVLAVREHRPPPNPPSPPRFRLRELPPAFRAYLIAWGAFALANSSDVFLLLKAQRTFGADHLLSGSQLALASIHVLLLYAFYNLVYAGASPKLGQLSDRFGRKRILIAGLMVFAVVYIGLAFLREAWHLWALFGLYGLYTAATDGVGKAMAVDLVPATMRASAVGLLGTVSGVATLAASAIAGLLWTLPGPEGWATFVYGASGAVVGAALLARVSLPVARPE